VVAPVVVWVVGWLVGLGGVVRCGVVWCYLLRRQLKSPIEPLSWGPSVSVVRMRVLSFRPPMDVEHPNSNPFECGAVH